MADNINFFSILPWLIGFICSRVYPFTSSLYCSFTSYDLFNRISKSGLMDYEKVFMDEDTVHVFRIAFKYAIFDVPLKLAFTLLIAYILDFKLRGVNFLRTTYYIPSILGGSIAIAILRRVVFNNDGLISTVITLFGGDRINWMASDDGTMAVIVLLRVWQFNSAMVIFLTALKSVSQGLYEAASVDDAGKWIQFFKITVPLVTPVVFYNLITQLCQAFQESSGPFLVTKGGPDDGTALISILIYSDTFLRHKMGIANAQAWVLFIIIIVFTTVTFISQGK